MLMLFTRNMGRAARLADLRVVFALDCAVGQQLPSEVAEVAAAQNSRGKPPSFVQ